MSDLFTPEDNTMVCVYGPPEYFDDPSSEHSGNSDESEKGSFLDKIIALFRKLIVFLKGLFS